MYDIAIVGAGPAGATLARLIAGRYRVLLVDRRNFHAPPGGPAGKCCGGLVAPDAQYVLGVMGLALPKSIIVGPQIFAVRTIDLQSHQERYYQRFYINVDREQFDRWLVSLIPDGVDARWPCLCKDIRYDGSNYSLTLVEKGKQYTEKARLVIGADGASSVLRSKLFTTKNTPQKYVAIQEWFSVKEAQPYFSVFFDSEITDFYAWSIPKENELVLGAALQQWEPSAQFELLKQKLIKLGYPLAHRSRREGAFVLRPGFPNFPVVQQPGIALIGEAAGWISPSSAEGFSYAFRSALAAAESLQDGLEHFLPRYEKNTAKLRRNLLIKRLKTPVMYNKGLRKLVMASGLESLRILKS